MCIVVLMSFHCGILIEFHYIYTVALTSIKVSIGRIIKIGPYLLELPQKDSVGVFLTHDVFLWLGKSEQVCPRLYVVM